MSFLLKQMMRRLHKVTDGEGGDLGGDYGDNFTPTDDDPKTGTDADADADAEAETEAEGEGDSALREAVADLESGADPDKPAANGTPRTGKNKMIPLDRHEKMLKKERARREEAEALVAQSRSGQQVARLNVDLQQAENELVGMEQKYNELLAEGDTQGAAAMMTHIRRKNSDLNAMTSEHRDAEVMAKAVEKVRYEDTLDRIELAYPALDPQHDDYDPEVYQDVLDLMQKGQERGLTPTKALQRAVARTLGAATGSQKSATTVTPRVNEDEVAAERRGEAVSRNLDAARRTPPSTARTSIPNAGGALTAKAVLAMSEKEFEKLSDKDLSRLRGDTL